ncbi:unnamed protein product [Mytilus coruscus]|uniref:Uncharacterized protein n=1 Tax=Mytilus coruscus TaxID=42192 RepID=A0A6J8DF56_MYTCO|nr:unnamed protein product [Mytilus coruscus]
MQCNTGRKSDIPTPDRAKSYPNLQEIAHQMLDLKPKIDIQLLISKAVPGTHHVYRQDRKEHYFPRSSFSVVNSLRPTANIEQIIYQEGRNFLRFLWYKDNNPDSLLIEHRMFVNVFGNSAGLAVPKYGLRRMVENSGETFGSDVKTFVNIYVDDGSFRCPINALKTGCNIRLHKITSNSSDMMKDFPTYNIGKNFQNSNLCEDYCPVQRFGIAWDLNNNSFEFIPLRNNKPFIRIGILSSFNSFFAPMEFLSPLTISGQIFLRDASPPGTDLNDFLSINFQEKGNERRIAVLSLR